MVVGIDVLVASARTFYEIYRLCEQRKANDAAIALLKDRIDTLVASVENLSKSSEVIATAFQSMQELVRRLQAAISSARMIVERYAEANKAKRIAFSGGHRDRLMNVNNELNGCAADLNLIMSMRIFADSETLEARQLREERLNAELIAINDKFVAAIEEDALKHDAIVRAIREQSAAQQQLGADILRQGREMSEGIHDHLDDMQKQLLKRMKTMNVISARTIEKRHVSNYSTIHEGRHIVQLCEYSDGENRIPCIFKYINPGNNRIIGYHQVDNTSTEVAALTTLKIHPYFPKMLGKFERDSNSVGILMEYVGKPDQKPLSLRSYLTNNIVEWSERLRFMRQIVSAVAFMHKHGIVHCGLNSDDILIQHDPDYGSNIKLMDFDRAIFMGADTSIPMPDIESRLHEHPYFAPEIHNHGHPSYSTDIFAVGTLLWEIAYCTIPYNVILSGLRDGLPSGKLDSAPSELTEVIRKCWSQDPASRPTAQKLDEATFDIYRCDVATSRKVKSGRVGDPGVPSTLREWRDEYLRIRCGLSSEDLVCIRVISSFWNDPRLPSDYLPSNTESRKAEAYKWLEYAVDHYEYGGAAYEIGKQYFGGIQNPAGRDWLVKAKEFQYKEERTLSREQYEKTGKDMEVLSKMRDLLNERRQIQRKGISVF
ncbi:kinase-like domain-containing protein [Chytridium lagenaria]|nr:kinase-like domain-containing protein [Chytridium lagenaria]